MTAARAGMRSTLAPRSGGHVERVGKCPERKPAQDQDRRCPVFPWFADCAGTSRS